MEAGKTNKPKKRDRIGVILYVFYVFMLLMSIVLIGGIVYIQLFFRPDKAIVEALTPNDQIRKIDPVRGNIYDCNGKLLAISCPSYQFYMDCTVLKDRNKPEEEQAWLDKAKELSKALADELKDKSAEEYYKSIVDGRNKGNKYLRLTRKVDYDTRNRIVEFPLFREGRFKSGMIEVRTDVRQYPYGELARRTIGFVRDNSSDVANTHIGLEGKFDYILHGTQGREYLRRTDRGRVVNSDSVRVQAVDGKDLHTTLNIDYQEIADNLGRHVKSIDNALQRVKLKLEKYLEETGRNH